MFCSYIFTIRENTILENKICKLNCTSEDLKCKKKVKFASLSKRNVGSVIAKRSCKLIGERARHYQGCTNSSWCGIYIYVLRYVCHMPRLHSVGGVRPLPFFICSSSFIRSNQWKRHGHLKCFKMEPCAWV